MVQKKMPETEPDTLLSNLEAAQVVGVGVATWNRLRKAGIAPAPAVEKPRCVRFSRRAVETFAADRAGR